MTQDNIIQQTNDYFRQELFIEDDLMPDTELKRDLGLTSVDAVAIALFAERQFACPILIQEMKAILTMQDLYDYIAQHQSKIK